MNALRVALVDDHAVARAGLRVLLEKLPGVSVVGEARNGRDALKMVKTVMPHLLLLDNSVAESGGLEVLPRLVGDFPSVKVLILSSHANEEDVFRALRNGAGGYLLKDAAAEELQLAVHAVARGQTYLSPAVSRTVVEGYLKRVEEVKGPVELLTGRQREVLQLIAEGGSTKEIAHSLGVSVKTVEAHRSQIMDRLDIHDVAGLVRYAVRSGLTSADK